MDETLNHPFFAKPNKPDVIAHRGGDGQWPGETMYAMRKAKKIGSDVLEMDAYRTKDHELVLMHDIEVRKTTKGSGYIYDHTLEELRALHADHHWSQSCLARRSKTKSQDISEDDEEVQVPALRDVLKAFSEMRMVIEMKKAPERFSPVAALCDLIKESKMTDKVLVASFHTTFMRDFRKSLPEVATSLTVSRQDIKSLLTPESFQKFLTRRLDGAVTENGPDAVQVPYWVINKQVVDFVKHRGLALHAWTVNRVHSMERMISLGVDGIIRDCPGTLLTLLHRTANTD